MAEVDEPPLVLEQLARRRLSRRICERCLERCAVVPPELGDAVVGVGTAAARAQHVLERIVERVHLHVAADAQRRGVSSHERAVRLPPVALELRARELRQPAEAEDELQHGGLARREIVCSSCIRSERSPSTRSRPPRNASVRSRRPVWIASQSAADAVTVTAGSPTVPSCRVASPLRDRTYHDPPPGPVRWNCTRTVTSSSRITSR